MRKLTRWFSTPFPWLALLLFVFVAWMAWPQSNQNNFPGSFGANLTTAGLTANTIPKATGSNLLGNSSVTDNGTQVSTAEAIYHTDGSGGLLITSVSNLPGLWVAANTVSPSTSNYALLGINNDTYVNANSSGTVQIRNANTTEVTVNSASVSIALPMVSSGTAAGLSGTGACASLSSQLGGSWAGKVSCTGTTGASTLIVTPGLTATNGWSCFGSDITAGTALAQSASSTTACTLKGTVTLNDVLTFTANAF